MMKILHYILIFLAVLMLLYPKDGFPLPFWTKALAFFYIMYAIIKLLKQLPSKHQDKNEEL